MDLREKRVTLVGMGRTSLALAKLLLRERARPFVTERDDTPRLDPLRAELDRIGVPYECGGHSERAFMNADMIVPSPGVSPALPPILAARDRGTMVTGEMEVAFAFCRSCILAVTGTNGKTTTTELLQAILRACGHGVVLAGNNDTPFSQAVCIKPAPQYIVLEVSSYQLEMAQTFRPWVAAVLNVTPDHLERHGTMEDYARVKACIFANQRLGDIAVLNADDPWTCRMPVPHSGVWQFSLEKRCERGLWLDRDVIRDGTEEVAQASDTLLPGKHNLQNVLAALTMVRAGGFHWDHVLAGLRSFPGVEHRIERVAEINGVAFYNDSKSTNVASLKVALESFSRPVILLAGGRGKGADYGVLRELIGRCVKRLVTLGEDAARLEAAFADVVPTTRADDMEDAVRQAAAIAASGDVVLLSPACASFDMFDNFEHRGRVFKDCVHRIAGRPPSGERGRDEPGHYAMRNLQS